MSSTDAKWPQGHASLLLEEIDSTMFEASRRSSGIMQPTWITAQRQTSGRGRSGRDWNGGEGNLLTTLIFRPNCGPADAAKRAFVAASALLEVLAEHVDRSRLSLKWPNDVLLDERKVAGILLESAGTPDVDWLAIGFGVNVAEAPTLPDAAFPPISLAEVEVEVSPQDLLISLADQFARRELVFATQGFGPIRQHWMNHAARLGETITARTNQDSLTGIFEGIDQSGALILVTGAGAQSVPAADVYFYASSN